MNLENNLDKANCTFIKTWSTSIKENESIFYANLDNFIPKEWQLLLMSDGSLTRHLNILRKDKVQVKLILNDRTVRGDRKYYIVNELSKMKREAWLINNNQALIFAQSYWLETEYSSQFKSCKPIGQVLIDNEINIHRELTQIYCGYCELIESKFGNRGPLWGRSYLLYFNHTPTLIINEIFSPYLVKDIKIFNHKTHA